MMAIRTDYTRCFIKRVRSGPLKRNGEVSGYGPGVCQEPWIIWSRIRILQQIRSFHSDTLVSEKLLSGQGLRMKDLPLLFPIIQDVAALLFPAGDSERR